MSIDFYNKTENFLERKATANGVSHLEKYYKVTDTKLGWYQTFKGSEIAICFAQLAFHAQNATMISNIVKFQEKFEFLFDVCCGFEPSTFLSKYCPSSRTTEEQISTIVEALRYSEETNPNGLVWDTSKSEKKDSMAKRYAKALINGAKYLSQFRTKHELLKDLKDQNTLYKRGKKTDNNRNLIYYFMNQMGEGSGFSVALTCDYLKELDVTFNNLAKPDIHIMDVMAAFKHLPDNHYYNGKANALKCLSDFQDLVKDINKELPADKQITVYQLDRMIWLICSGNFFLDTVGLEKQDYINEIS